MNSCHQWLPFLYFVKFFFILNIFTMILNHHLCAVMSAFLECCGYVVAWNELEVSVMMCSDWQQRINMSCRWGWSAVRINSSADNHSCVVVDCSACVGDDMLPRCHSATTVRLQVISFVFCFLCKVIVFKHVKCTIICMHFFPWWDFRMDSATTPSVFCAIFTGAYRCGC